MAPQGGAETQFPYPAELVSFDFAGSMQHHHGTRRCGQLLEGAMGELKQFLEGRRRSKESLYKLES